MRRAAVLAVGLAVLTLAPAAAQQDAPRRVTLDEAVEMALRNSPQLDRSEALLETSEFDRLDAVGDFLPDLNLGYGFSDASTGRLDPTGQAITTTSWTLQLQGSLELFDGFRRFNSLTGSRRRVAAEEARHRRSRYETILDVSRAYYDAVARRELVRVEEDRVERQEAQLELVRQQVELGQANRSDLLRSRVDRNRARLDLLTARNEARAATFSLARAVGVDRRLAPVREASLEVSPLPYDRQELVRRALDNGPSVVSARAEAEAREAEVATARSAYLPSLTFQGGWAWQNSEFPPGNRSWSILLQGSLPLFDGFQRESRLARAQAQARAARADERAAELELRARTDEAFNQVEAAQAAVELAETNVELSREDLRLTRERYRLGLATILDLQSAQITLQQAEVELVQRRFDYHLGVAQLESLVGADLDPSP